MYNKASSFAAIAASALLWAHSSHAQTSNPTGPAGQFNGNSTTGCSYDPYTGNATRTVTDLTVGGAVGAYPLQWSRTMNSREASTAPDGTTPNGFGGGGGWRHSYSWDLADGPEYGPNTTYPDPPSPSSYGVQFPDGRTITFDRTVTGDTALHGPLGVPERFQPLNTTTKLAYLLLPDGGKVEFVGTKFQWAEDIGEHLPNSGYYAKWLFQPQALIDPSGLRTTLAYNADGTLFKVTEPAGRWLKPTYTAGQVTRLDGGNASGAITESVSYTYTSQIFSGVSYSLLTGVTYLSDPGAPTAGYTYQTSNVTTTHSPLIATCDDQHFAGPMKKIAYDFDVTTTGRNYGQLLREKHPNGTVVTTLGAAVVSGSTVTVSETRGDGAMRTWKYGTTPTGFTAPPASYLLTEVSDFKGKSTYFEYDANGFQDKVKNPVGAVTSYARLALTGKLSVMTLPADVNGNTPTRQYGYQDPTTGYYQTSMTDERNKITSYLRDATTHRVYQINYPDTSSEAFVFDNGAANGFGRVTRKTLKNGAYIHYSVDGQGLVYKEWNPTTSATPVDTEPKSSTQFYPAGDAWENYIYKVTDQLSHVTTYEYEKKADGSHCTGRGLVTKITHNDGKFLQYGYNPDGTLAWSADENHPNATSTTQSTRYTYDDYKRIASKTDPLNHQTTYTYVRWNHGSSPYDHTDPLVFRQTSPFGLSVDHDCDDNYRVTSETKAPGYAPEKAVTAFAYYDDGTLQSVIDPRLKTTTYFYDLRGRKIGMNDAAGDLNAATPPRTVSWSYDTAQNITTEQRANDQTVASQYDDMGRLKTQTVKRTTTVSDVTQMTYWPDGNLKTMTDPMGKIYSYDYDLRGHKWHATYPLDSGGIARQEIWVYDDADNLFTFKNRNGKTQTFIYDDRNRATSFSWDDGVTSSQVNHYDDASRVTGVDNSSGSVGFTYFDDNTLQTQTQLPGGLPGTQWTTSYTYDADGRRATMLYPSTNQYTYTYNRRNQLLNINDTANPTWTPVVAYTYDLAGNRLTRDLRNGGHSGYTIDPAMNRVATIQHQFADQQWQFGYGYDDVGRRTYEQRQKFPISAPSPAPSPTPSPGTSNLADGYVYNLAGELTTFTRDGTLQANGTVTGGAAVSGLTYDANGNRTALNGSGYVVNDLNEYTTANGATGLSYNVNGDLTGYNGWTYTYDAQDRLTQASITGTTVTYAYDGLNRQLYHDITTSAGTTRTYNVWDGWNLLEERNSAGAVVHCYIHGAATDEMVSRFQGGFPTRYYYQDGRGNTTHLTGDLNYIQERYTYGFAGNVFIYNATGGTQSTTDNRFLFTGRDYMPETGVYDFRNRFYLPGIGRFLQPDPIGFDGDDTNLYRYCGGDPVNFIDPVGLERWFAGQRDVAGPRSEANDVYMQGMTQNMFNYAVATGISAAFTTRTSLGVRLGLLGGAITGAIRYIQTTPYPDEHPTPNRGGTDIQNFGGFQPTAGSEARFGLDSGLAPTEFTVTTNPTGTYYNSSSDTWERWDPDLQTFVPAAAPNPSDPGSNPSSGGASPADSGTTGDAGGNSTNTGFGSIWSGERTSGGYPVGLPGGYGNMGFAVGGGGWITQALLKKH